MSDKLTFEQERAEIDLQLAKLEDRFEMKSDVFYRRWLEGVETDTHERNAWAMLIQAQRNLDLQAAVSALQKRLDEAEGGK